MGASVSTGHSEKLQSNGSRSSARRGALLLQKRTVAASVLRLGIFLGAAVTWGTCTLPIFSLNGEKNALCRTVYCTIFINVLRTSYSVF